MCWAIRPSRQGIYNHFIKYEQSKWKIPCLPFPYSSPVSNIQYIYDVWQTDFHTLYLTIFKIEIILYSPDHAFHSWGNKELSQCSTTCANCIN